MKLSVIVPSFNREALLPRALTSVLLQALPDRITSMQLIVVDDGSTDKTEQVVRETFPGVDYIKQNNKGVSSARNSGLSISNGEWIAFLDSDDEWLPNKLKKQFSALQDSENKVCHTEEIWIRNSVRVNQMNKHQKSGGWIFEKCLPLCAMSPSSIVIHQSVFEHVGSFDEELPACEDYDLWLRIASQYPVDFVIEPCIKKYGGHADQLSQLHWGMDRFRIKALDKILNMPLDQVQYAAALKVRNAKLAILLKGAIKHGNSELIADCEKRMLKFQTPIGQ